MLVLTRIFIVEFCYNLATILGQCKMILSPKQLVQDGARFISLSLANRPFAGSGHMVRNKLHWDENNAVGLSKQRKVGLDW